MMSSSLRRMSAVTALKLESHEPQSRSMALLVVSDVVSGPGVRRIGSREKRAMAISSSGLAGRRGVTPALRAAHEPAFGGKGKERDDAGRYDDQGRHRRGRADRARLVELHD